MTDCSIVLNRRKKERKTHKLYKKQISKTAKTVFYELVELLEAKLFLLNFNKLVYIHGG